MIDSPDAAGEAALLARLAPRAPAALHRRIAGLFAELRAHVAEGLLSYPYSTREAVSIARHLQAFPEDGLVGAADNVFAFDAHEPALAAQLAAILRRHGIPAGGLGAAQRDGGALFREAQAERLPLPPLEPHELWALGAAQRAGGGGPQHEGERAVQLLPPAPCELQRLALDDVRRYRLAAQPVQPLADAEMRSGRLHTFCEARLRLQLARRQDGKAAQVVALCAGREGDVHALLHDLTLVSLRPARGSRTELALGTTFLHAPRGAASGALLRPLPAGCALARTDADGDPASPGSGGDEGGGHAEGGLVVFAPAAGLLLALSRAERGAGFDVVSSIALPDALRPGAGSGAAGYASGYAASLLAGLGGAAGREARTPLVSAGAQQGAHWAAWLPAAGGGGSAEEQLCIFDAGCSQLVSVRLAHPARHSTAAAGAHAAASAAPGGQLRAVAPLDGDGGAWLLEWEGGSTSVLALRGASGGLGAEGAVHAEQWPLLRTPLGAQPGAQPPPLALRSSALGPALGGDAGGGAHSVRLVGAPGDGASVGGAGATPGQAGEGARAFSVLEAARLLGGLGAGTKGTAPQPQALLLSVSVPPPPAAAAAQPEQPASAAALAAAAAADEAALGAAAPSPWRTGSGRLGRLLAHLPASDSLVFAAAEGGSAAMHVLSLGESTVYALRGGGVADEAAGGGGGAEGGAAGKRLLPTVVAAAALPASGGNAEGLVSAHADGSLVLWDVSQSQLGSAITEWRQIVGLPAGGNNGEGGGRRGAAVKKAGSELGGAAIRASDNAAPTSMPKKGEVDPTGNPHVGGNRWAGGTGGRDTAGLGGRGGPYRLDGGHDIHQLSDELKAQVSPEALAAAREMAAAAHAERLKEIDMSPFEADAYSRIVSGVRREIRQLRNVLEGHEAREKSRVWLGGQSSGELDESRLVDGLAGESGIYKLRADAPPDSGGAPQLKPKVREACGSAARNPLGCRAPACEAAAKAAGQAGDLSHDARGIARRLPPSTARARQATLTCAPPPHRCPARLRCCASSSTCRAACTTSTASTAASTGRCRRRRW